MTVNNKIPTSCKTDLLTGQQFIDLLPAIELLTDGLIFIGSTSHVILTSAVFTSKGEMASSRFANMSDEDMEKLVEDASSQNTKNVINVAWKIFEQYIVEKLHIRPSCQQDMSAKSLVPVLRKFYCNVRNRNGEPYVKKTMISIRYGLQKKFEKSHKFDIVNDDRFKDSNDIFHACLKKMKKDGAGESKHKEVISEEDIKRLYSTLTLSTKTPKSLQYKVFFELMMFMCNRGRENLRNMTKEDFVVDTDAGGRRYVVYVKKRLSKNHQGGVDDLDDGGGRMYEKPG